MNKLSLFSAQLLRTNVVTQLLNGIIAKSNRYISKSTPSSQDIDHTYTRNENLVAKNSLEELTPEEEKKLKVFKLEFDVFRSTGIVVPSVMTDKEWLYVIQYCQGFHRRKSYYSYLFKNEMRTASLKEKAKVNIKLQKEKLAELERLQAEGHIERFRNRFMLLLLDRTANVFYYNNIFWNMVNGGQRLVFDFSYEDQMNIFELTDLTRQIYGCHGLNKVSKDPFVFHFCNLDPNSVTFSKIKLAIANLDVAPVTTSSDSYLNHYPKDRLVYLTPDAAENLTYDPDDVYIIGSIVDKRAQTPLSLAKAKREGIRTAKLPLDRYIKWTQGKKALPLNQVVSVLERVKATGDWVEALTTGLPSRKFTTISEELERTEKKFKPKSFKIHPRHSVSQ